MNNVQYPRHWWVSTNTFTCYVRTDEDNKITSGSTGFAVGYIGKSAEAFGKLISRKFGGLVFSEFNADGKWL